MTHLLYYVSGHGYGHASRSAEVMRQLAARRPGLRITVETAAPARFFAGIPGLMVRTPTVPLEAGVVEHDPLRPDRAATVRRLLAVLEQREDSVAVTAERMRADRADAVICDIPFLVGDAAARAGLPCIGVSNFTWDWIYGPFLEGRPQTEDAIGAVRSGYARIGTLLRLPFGQTADVFGQTIDVPLVAGRRRRPRAEVLTKLGIDPSDGRTRVLAATRGTLAAEALTTAAEAGPEFLFICTLPLDGVTADNVRIASPEGGLTFPDVLGVCDVVISKLGYSIASECLAARTALLYPPRQLFAEDELTAAALPHYIRAAPMSAEDFDAGRWPDPLRRLLAQPKPTAVLRSDGGEVCADLILKRV